jgi:predicted nucleic acid-binding protein
VNFIDTNVVIRYLTRDPPVQSERARALIESDAVLLVTSVTLLETYFVLQNDYGIERETVLDHLTELVLRRSIGTSDADKAHVVAALDLCRGSRRVSCADALIWASVRSRTSVRDVARLYSFDRRFPEQEIDLREP